MMTERKPPRREDPAPDAPPRRKPPQMSFTSWIDQQVADAEHRGVFDDLPGAGKPLNLRPGAPDGDYGQAWLRDYARREGVPAEEMLPAPLRLRREIERLAETAGEFRSEQEVREAAADLNRRIVEWRRIPVGPPVHVRLVNAEDLVARWRAARSERAAREAAASAAERRQADQSATPSPRRPRWRAWRPGRRRPGRRGG
jgi:DnaJ homologue, subfamily C, member 28, conserved domain